MSMAASTEMADGVEANAALWRAADMQTDQSWIFELSPSHQQELHAAVQETIRRGLAIHDISQDSFSLPTLGAELRERHRDVVWGRGFTLLRGVPVDAMSREEVVRAYFGIGAYFGVAVPQNAKGHLVGHVKDIGHDPSDPKTRI